MLRYDRPRTDLLGVLDSILIFREFIDGSKRGGTTLLYQMMEYHLDPELHS